MPSRTPFEVQGDYYERQVKALTDRCALAENALADLLLMIDPELLPRHAHDWQAAVDELLGKR